MKRLQQITCDRTCGFLARSGEKTELVRIYKKHAKQKHANTVTSASILRKIHPASFV